MGWVGHETQWREKNAHKIFDGKREENENT
jgi:hypothetical protein